MRHLIFNADDYGLSPAVSRGILDAARGVVRATSVMANFVTADEADWLRGSGLSLAAHLNLSTGYPLTSGYPTALLKPDGSFDKAQALTPGTWEPARHRGAAAAEWNAQLARLNELELPIDHLDSHHHSHMLAPLLPEAVRFAVDNALPLRCRPADKAYLDAAGVPAPDDFIESFFGYALITRQALLAALATAQGSRVEVMCHPGRVDAELRQRSGYLEEREAELALLGEPTLAAELETAGWKLSGYEILR